MEMVVLTPAVLSESSIPIPLRDRYRWQWDSTTEPILCRLSWWTSWRPIWHPDAYVWWPQLPSSRWHLPTCSRGYDRWRRGGIRCWCWDVAPKPKKHLDNEYRLPKVRTEALKEVYQTAAIPWSHPKLCHWSLCQLRAKRCCWWRCGWATGA